MHELGHTLGLTHGGEGDHTNYKPNYYSNMNYLWQLPDALYNPNGLLDYSQSRLADLNESSLNETMGIGGPPIPNLRVPLDVPAGRLLVPMNGAVDWSNGDQDLDGTADNDVGVMANINRSSFPDPQLSVLAGAEDWSRLMYAFRQNLYFSPGETYEPAPEDVDMSFELAQQLHEELLDGMSADFDGDHDVDGGDFLRWQRGLSAPNATLADGDADYDEDVDGVDLYVWRQKFGSVAGTGAPSSAAAVISPPAAPLLDRENLVDAAMAVAFASPAAARRGIALRSSAATKIFSPVQLKWRWSGHAIERISASSAIEITHRMADAQERRLNDAGNDALSQPLLAFSGVTPKQVSSGFSAR
jgi:hypothetical protein